MTRKQVNLPSTHCASSPKEIILSSLYALCNNRRSRCMSLPSCLGRIFSFPVLRSTMPSAIPFMSLIGNAAWVLPCISAITVDDVSKESKRYCLKNMKISKDVRWLYTMKEISSERFINIKRCKISLYCHKKKKKVKIIFYAFLASSLYLWTKQQLMGYMITVI